MAEESFLEKTEQATPKRREEARKKGQVAKSIEVNSAFVLLFSIIILYFSGNFLFTRLSILLRDVIRSLNTISVTPDGIRSFFLVIFVHIGIILFPMMLLLMFVGMLGSYSQVGFLFTTDPLTPKFDRLNPFTGIKRVIFSKRSLIELMKGLLKVIIIGVVGWSSIQTYIAESTLLMDSDVLSIFLFLCKAAINVSFKITLVFLILAAIDYFLQRRLFENEIKMTKDEVKEENKQLEGDPIIKGRIRSLQRQLARRRMMQEVPKADVVITNPTHLAIALKYDFGNMAAPKVVAKGADRIAEKIKEIAKEYNIPVIEDKPLAQLIYKSVDIDETIPQDMYQAVAQILAYIYKLKKKKISFN
jgi:flagellar biosynthetic protein FlhB